MERTTIMQIEERLNQLPPEKLTAVLDFVSSLATRGSASEAFQAMLASESVLSRDWSKPEEEAAWADL